MKSFLTCFVAWAIAVLDLEFEYCSYVSYDLWEFLTPGWVQESWPAWEYSWRLDPETGEWSPAWPVEF
jgi:hypothetical protein